MASTYLTRTFGTATNRKKGTLSFWMKTSNSAGGMVGNYTNDTNRATLYWGNDSIKYYDGEANVEYNATARLLRDPNAWYHIVLMINTEDGTQADRVRIYINGERQSPITGNQAYNQNENSHMFNPTSAFSIGRDTYSSGGQDYFNGVISHFHYCDGQAYDASSFGSTDSTTGEWKINTSPSVTYGNNGFFILKDGNSVTDQSGNSNNFTVGGGTLTKTEDSPSNVFATFNSLYKSNETLSFGNTRSVLATSDQFGGVSTTGVATGKWYAEFKANIAGSAYYGCGIIGDVSFSSNNNVGAGRNKSIGYRSGDGQKGVDNTFSSYGATYTTNDIIGIALDLDSSTNTITFYKNGVSQGAINITVPNPDGFWHFCACSMGTGGASDWSANFGNGYFGTTAVSSAGTNASGNGIFEYDVPSGYTALSTKGLNL